MALVTTIKSKVEERGHIVVTVWEKDSYSSSPSAISARVVKVRPFDLSSSIGIRSLFGTVKGGDVVRRMSLHREEVARATCLHR